MEGEGEVERVSSEENETTLTVDPGTSSSSVGSSNNVQPGHNNPMTPAAAAASASSLPPPPFCGCGYSHQQLYNPASQMCPAYCPYPYTGRYSEYATPTPHPLPSQPAQRESSATQPSPIQQQSSTQDHPLYLGYGSQGYYYPQNAYYPNQSPASNLYGSGRHPSTSAQLHGQLYGDRTSNYPQSIHYGYNSSVYGSSVTGQAFRTRNLERKSESDDDVEIIDVVTVGSLKSGKDKPSQTPKKNLTSEHSNEGRNPEASTPPAPKSTSSELDSILNAIQSEPSRIVQALGPAFKDWMKTVLVEPQITTIPTVANTSVVPITESVSKPPANPEEITASSSATAGAVIAADNEKQICSKTRESPVDIFIDSIDTERKWILNESIQFHLRLLENDNDKYRKSMMGVHEDLKQLLTSEEMMTFHPMFTPLGEAYFDLTPEELKTFVQTLSTAIATKPNTSTEIPVRLLDAIIRPKNHDDRSQERFGLAKKIDEYLIHEAEKSTAFRRAFLAYNMNTVNQAEVINDESKRYREQTNAYHELVELVQAHPSLHRDFFETFEMPSILKGKGKDIRSNKRLKTNLSWELDVDGSSSDNFNIIDNRTLAKLKKESKPKINRKPCKMR